MERVVAEGQATRGPAREITIRIVAVGEIGAALGASGQLVGRVITVGRRRGAYPQCGGGQVA